VPNYSSFITTFSQEKKVEKNLYILTTSPLLTGGIPIYQTESSPSRAQLSSSTPAS